MTTTEAPEQGGNSLVAKPEESSGAVDVNSQNWSAGSGPISDAATTVSDFKDGNWGGFAMDAVNDGMDLLAVAMDPLGSLASAGIGWLIEHIKFLHEALDKLAGNPEAITAHAQTWTNISNQMKQAGSQYQSAKSGVLQTYQCTSAEAYSKTGDDFTKLLQGSAEHADHAATAMQIGGALVGTERGVIRDMISEFVGQLIVKAGIALAASFFTFGGAAAAFIADTVVEGGLLAEKLGTKIAKVIEQLTKLGGDAEKSAKKLEEVEKALKKLRDKKATSSTTLKDGMENAGKKAEKANEKVADHTVSAAANKVQEKTVGLDQHGKHEAPRTSFSDRVENFHTKTQEKGALGNGGWTAKSQAEHSNKWNTADSVATGQEAGRQANEQHARNSEAAEQYEDGNPEKAEELKKTEEYEWPTADQDR